MPPREPTWRWSALSPALQRLARAELERELRDALGLDPSSAHVAALILPDLDLSYLSLPTAEAARVLGIGHHRVNVLRNEGTLPYMVEHASGGHTHTRIFWRAVVTAWAEWRRDHERPVGRGARFWPEG